MEVLEEAESALSNFEVLRFLREEREKLHTGGKKKKVNPHPRSGQVCTTFI